MPQDHSDERLRRIGKAMRDCFFAEFGDLDRMADAEMNECIKSMVAIHCGELIEVGARFKSPDKTVREVCIGFLDLMLASNEAEVETILHEDDKAAYLRGDEPN